MKESTFRTDAPGRLVRTSAYEVVVRAGVPETVSVSGQAFVPDPLPPKIEWDSLVGRVTESLVTAERSLARLDGKASRLTDPRLLLGPFWRREARLSSLIEDTVTTPRELALVDAGRTVEKSEQREVLNYIRALEHGLESKLPLSNRLIRDMHRVLLEGVRGERDTPGEFRREQNYIGNQARGFSGARFVPPPAGEPLEECMKQLERFLNDQSQAVPDLIGIALTHYQFEAIHPFRDGNGRLGRLIIVLAICKRGILSKPLLYVSEYFEKNKEEYKSLLLRISTHGEWEDWIRFVLNGLGETAIDAGKRVDKVLSLREELIKRVTGPRTSSLQIQLIDHLFTKPAITVKKARQVLGVTDTAARRHIESLVRHRILEEMQDSGREQWYLARRIFEATDLSNS